SWFPSASVQSGLGHLGTVIYCLSPGESAPAAVAGRFPVSVAGTLLRSSAASQSPAHSLVPLTVPTNLQPGEPFGFICTNGLLPILGGAVWANAVAEKPIAARTSKTLIVNFPFALSPKLDDAAYRLRFVEAANVWR